MRRYWPLALAMSLAGCGGLGPESKIVGKWHVDPATVISSRLGPDADRRPDWADATKVLGGVEVDFTTDGHAVTAKGLGQASAATWGLRGSEVLIASPTGEKWPTMEFDPKGQRIHLVLEKAGDRLTMDLVKG